jgi:Domain of unknown function (DUF4337)
MGAHENLEHAEHAAHSGHTGKHIGVTMALLGVLIAFAAAMVGSQRQELVTSLMDQGWAHASFTGAATKFRIVMTELQKMRGASPAATSPENASPALKTSLRLYANYAEERKLAEAWDNSCEGLIDAHFDAAEGYEHAQLIAEVAIIIASIAILMTSRTAWLVSVVIGALAVGQIGYTFASSRAAIHEHHDKVHHAQEAFEELIEKHLDTAEDEATVNDLDPGGSIRSSIQKDSTKEPAKPETPAEAKHD